MPEGFSYLPIAQLEHSWFIPLLSTGDAAVNVALLTMGIQAPAQSAAIKMRKRPFTPKGPRLDQAFTRDGSFTHCSAVMTQRSM